MRRMILSCIAIAAMFSVQTSFASIDYFFDLDGIEGESRDPNRPGYIDVLSWSWSVSNSAAVSSGLASGKRQHKPFVITKVMDKSSPKLAEACVKGVTLKKATLELTRATPTGGHETYMTITMTDVLITSYQSGGSGSETGQITMMPTEEITFTYQKIEIKWIDGGIEMVDTWSKR